MPTRSCSPRAEGWESRTVAGLEVDELEVAAVEADRRHERDREESGDQVGRNTAAGSPSDDAGSCETPTGTSSWALLPSAFAIQSSPAVSLDVVEANERELLPVRRGRGLVVARAVGDGGRRLPPGDDREDAALLCEVEGAPVGAGAVVDVDGSVVTASSVVGVVDVSPAVVGVVDPESSPQAVTPSPSTAIAPTSQPTRRIR